MTTYVWENITWSFYGGKPTIFIFARDVETKKFKKIAVQNFKPYFYVEDSEGDSLNCFGQPIHKVVCKTPVEVTERRNKYKALGTGTFNSDIPYEMQYLIDKGITYGFNEKLEPVALTAPVPPRIVYYDIELEIPHGEPIDVERNKYPIVAISVLDSYTICSKVFTIGTHAVHQAQVVCGDEAGVLTSFFNYVDEINPDILSGWNCQDFDMPYIIGRAAVSGVPTNKLSRTNSPVEKANRINGRSHVDMMQLFKLWNKPNGQLPTYGLKYVSKHIADFEYEAFGDKIQTLIENNDWHTLVEYNLNDVIALQKIDTTCGLHIFYENLRLICGIKYDDVMKNTKIVETLLLRYGIKPIPPYKKHTTDGLEGGYVKQPTVGVHKNVATLDAKCVDCNTDVLTERGWKNISELTTEKIATLNTTSNNIEFETPIEVYCYNYNGMMYEYTSRTIDFLVTPNHRMLYKKRNRNVSGGYGNYEYQSIQEIVSKKVGELSIPYFGEYNGIECNTITINNVVYNADDVLKYMGWYISEGWVEPNRCIVAQSKNEHIDEIESVCKIINKDYYIKKYKSRDGESLKFHIKDKLLCEWIIKNCGNGSFSKRIPVWIKKLNKRQLQILLDTLIKGDGCTTGYNYYYATVSKKLADDVQEIALKCGYPATLTRVNTNNGFIYRVGLTTRETRRNLVNLDKIKLVNYVGNVYCVSTTNSNFVMRRNGVVTITGNSLYPSIMLAKNISPDVDSSIPKILTRLLTEREKYRALRMSGESTSSDDTTEQSLKYIANSVYGVMASPYFKLYDLKCASLITSTGRDIVKKCSDILEENGFTVIYNDTDSTFIKDVYTLDDAYKLERIVNTSLLEWARQHHIKDEFAPIVKFEKFYKTLFFKKRAGISNEAARKKYVGHLIWKDGKEKNQIDYTGIEIKRSDTAPYTKEIMEQFFKSVLIDGKVEDAVNNVRNNYNKVLHGEVSPTKIAIPRAVNTQANSAHLKGMNNGTQLFGIRFNGSNKPRLLYCKSPYEEVCIDENVSDEQVLSKLTIDYDKMADRTVAQKMRSLIESLGYDWNESAHGQTKLNFGD